VYHSIINVSPEKIEGIVNWTLHVSIHARSSVRYIFISFVLGFTKVVVDGNIKFAVGFIGWLKLNDFVHKLVCQFSFCLSLAEINIFTCFSTGYGIGA